MRAVSFSVPFVAGKQRPRHMRNGHTYTPSETIARERHVRDAYMAAAVERYGFVAAAGASVPVCVEVACAIPLQKGQPKHVESAPFTVKPDADNVLKLVLDGLNGVAYRDDAQVNAANVSKLDRLRGEGPITYVTVSWEESEEKR